MLGSDEGITLGSTDDKFISTKLGNVYWIKLEIDVGKEMVSLDGFLDGSNYGNIEGLFLGDSLGSTYGNVFGSDKGITLGCNDVKVIGTILWNVDGIILGIDVGTELDS